MKQIDIEKVATGREVKTGALVFKTAAPLDDRFCVKNKAGLICQEVFGAKDVNNNFTSSKIWLFLGLSTTVKDTGDTYVLSDISDATGLRLWPFGADTNPESGTINYHILNDADGGEAWINSEIERGWTRLAKASEVSALQTTVDQNMQTLSGVFQFKGVASSIDKDFTTITITPLEYNSKTFNCVGYEYDYAHEKYKKWEASDNTVVYTKDGDSTRKIYTKGSSSDVLYVEHNGVIYYYDGESNNKTKFTALEGTSIYAGSTLSTDNLTSTTFYSSDTTQTSATTMFAETPAKYTASSFSVTENTYTDGTGMEKNASSVNTGAVYLIGDKEFASNGTIWVELGSPDLGNSWIVL